MITVEQATMRIDFEAVPVHLFRYQGLAGPADSPDDVSSPDVLVVAIGSALGNSLVSAPLSGGFRPASPNLCRTEAQLVSACDGVSSAIVVTQDHDPSTAVLAADLADSLRNTGTVPALWLDVCGLMPAGATTFAAHIVPHPRANAATDWLNAVLSELVQLQTDPGYIGVDVHDVLSTLGDEPALAYAAVGWGNGPESSADATHNALASLEAAGIDLSQASGVATLVSVDSAPVRQMRSVITLVQSRCADDATVTFANHSIQAPLTGARSVVLVGGQ